MDKDSFELIDYVKDLSPLISPIPIKYEPYIEQENIPWCQIYDLDGTLALMGDRKPFDWEKVSEDKVNKSVNHLLYLNAWASERYHGKTQADRIIILSGRSDICRKDTEKWIQSKLYGSHDGLFMRTNNDFRCDTIIKYELFNKYIRDKYNVRFIVDDRPKVCRMWRELGLPVLQVGDPHVEF